MNRTYSVTYRVGSNLEEDRTQCVTSPKYGTNFESLRQMIAIKRGVKIEDIEITIVRLLAAGE